MQQRTVWLLVLRAFGAFASFVLFVYGCFQIASSVMLEWDPPGPDYSTPGILDIQMKKGPWPIHFCIGILMVSLALTFLWMNRRQD